MYTEVVEGEFHKAGLRNATKFPDGEKRCFYLELYSMVKGEYKAAVYCFPDLSGWVSLSVPFLWFPHGCCSAALSPLWGIGERW